MTRSRLLLAIAYLLGLALICLGFVLFVPPWFPRDVAWLDFAVVCAVYSVNVLGFAGWRRDTAGFSLRIPRLAIFLWADPIYTLAALSIVCRGTALDVPFQLQLMLQLGLAFLMALAWVAAIMGAEQVAAVAAHEHGLADGTRQLQQALRSCQSAVLSRSQSWSGFRPALDRLEEDLRFLSPSASSSARSLDAELIQVLQAIGAVAASADENSARTELPRLLERWNAVMAQRRNARIEYGERG